MINISDFEVMDLKTNGTTCLAKTTNISWTNKETELLKLCNLGDFESESSIVECYDSEGSHQKTFWLYFTLRMIFQSAFLSIYSCNDGTALRHAQEYNSDYSWVQLYTYIATFLSPTIAGSLIIEAPIGSNGNHKFKFRAQSFTSLKEDLHLDINRGFPFNKLP